MERNTPLPGSLCELVAAHPEVVEVAPGTAGGYWHATVSMADGAYGYVHAADEAEMLAKLTAALGG
jgi:predicted methyltransferase